MILSGLCKYLCCPCNCTRLKCMVMLRLQHCQYNLFLSLLIVKIGFPRTVNFARSLCLWVVSVLVIRLVFTTVLASELLAKGTAILIFVMFLAYSCKALGARVVVQILLRSCKSIKHH